MLTSSQNAMICNLVYAISKHIACNEKELKRINHADRMAMVVLKAHCFNKGIPDYTLTLEDVTYTELGDMGVTFGNLTNNPSHKESVWSIECAIQHPLWDVYGSVVRHMIETNTERLWELVILAIWNFNLDNLDDPTIGSYRIESLFIGKSGIVRTEFIDFVGTLSQAMDLQQKTFEFTRTGFRLNVRLINRTGNRYLEVKALIKPAY